MLTRIVPIPDTLMSIYVETKLNLVEREKNPTEGHPELWMAFKKDEVPSTHFKIDYCEIKDKRNILADRLKHNISYSVKKKKYEHGKFQIELAAHNRRSAHLESILLTRGSHIWKAFCIKSISWRGPVHKRFQEVASGPN